MKTTLHIYLNDHKDSNTPDNISVKLDYITEKYRFYEIRLCLCLNPRGRFSKSFGIYVAMSFVFLSDSKQNGDANVAPSEEEGCSLTQPLSPSEKWSLRCTRGRDKAMKEATCFLLTSGDPSVHTGRLHTCPYVHLHL